MESVIAWVESPLQLVGAAEWAAAHDRPVPVAGRLTAQMSETADELLARGARFGPCEPYLGIPWIALARHEHWIVGDGFSGQFRLAASVLRPPRITFLDDGANTPSFADALSGRRAYSRPGVTEGRLSTTLAPFALDAVLRRALVGRVSLFTAFDLGDSRANAVAELGLRVERHGFEWTRAHAAPPVTDLERIVLGSALAVDDRMPLVEYVAWVRSAAAENAVYLPHRRETALVRRAVADTGVRILDTNLPVELVLAGTTRPLDIVTLPSSTETTLPLVLAGTGSVVRRVDGAGAVSRVRQGRDPR